MALIGLAFSGLLIGLSNPVTTHARSSYQIVKKNVDNSVSQVPYHLTNRTKNVYLWNKDHSKSLTNMKARKNYTWIYTGLSRILSKNGKKALYYYVQGLTPNGNYSKLSGLVWHGFLTPGVNPNFKKLNNISYSLFNSDNEYQKYIEDSPSQKLTRNVLRLFPNSKLSFKLTTEGAGSRDIGPWTGIPGFKDVHLFENTQKYFDRHFYKLNLSDDARFKLIKSAIEKSGYTPKKRASMGNYQIGIVYYSKAVPSEEIVTGLTLGIPTE